ncbi:hypothetical protein M8994_18365 [Brucella sp. 21LCYQ03]|nr:hypothetical protein [Brucella sp. 21LCYQ03]
MFRPVMAGMCRYESLIDGVLDLSDIARMNDALDVRDENQRRYQKATEKK